MNQLRYFELNIVLQVSVFWALVFKVSWFIPRKFLFSLILSTSQFNFITMNFAKMTNCHFVWNISISEYIKCYLFNHNFLQMRESSPIWEKNKLLLPAYPGEYSFHSIKLSFMFSSNKDIHFKTTIHRKHGKNCITRILRNLDQTSCHLSRDIYVRKVYLVIQAANNGNAWV